MDANVPPFVPAALRPEDEQLLLALLFVLGRSTQTPTPVQPSSAPSAGPGATSIAGDESELLAIDARDDAWLSRFQAPFRWRCLRSRWTGREIDVRIASRKQVIQFVRRCPADHLVCIRHEKPVSDLITEGLIACFQTYDIDMLLMLPLWVPRMHVAFLLCKDCGVVRGLLDQASCTVNDWKVHLEQFKPKMMAMPTRQSIWPDLVAIKLPMKHAEYMKHLVARRPHLKPPPYKPPGRLYDTHVESPHVDFGRSSSGAIVKEQWEVHCRDARMPEVISKVYCRECQMWLNSVSQWGYHRAGRKHRNNLLRNRIWQA